MKDGQGSSGSKKASAIAPLTLITNRKLCVHPLKDTIIESLIGGVNCVQLRENDLTTSELYSLARDLREITWKHDALLIINDRIDIALAVEADGVHLGWKSLPLGEARKLMTETKLIGVSTHNFKEAKAADANGADYITFGPIFYTPSKEGLIDITGTQAIREVKENIEIPVIALGGIKKTNAHEVMKAGADGIAVISGIITSEDPQQAAAELRQAISIS